jgi:hypothetical protein
LDIEPELESAWTSEPMSTWEPEPMPEPEPAWEPEPMPEPAWEPEPVAEPAWEPEPVVEPETESAWEKEPAWEQEPAWEPEPVAEPEPAWEPEPEPRQTWGSEPESTWEPMPEPSWDSDPEDEDPQFDDNPYAAYDAMDSWDDDEDDEDDDEYGTPAYQEVDGAYEGEQYGDEQYEDYDEPVYEDEAYDAEGAYVEDQYEDYAGPAYDDEVYEDAAEFDQDALEPLEDDFEIDYGEPEQNGLETTMSLRPLDGTERPSTDEMADDDALSWDDDVVVDGPRVAGLHLFGATGTIASYEGGPSIYDQGEDRGPATRGMRVRAIAVGASVAAAFILVYILGIQRFATRALPRTYVGDLDVSGLTAEEAQKALEDETANYACDVTVGDFTGTVKGADVAFDRDEERMARLAVESRPAFAWPVALIFSASINDNQGITFDEGALNNAVNALVGDYNRVNVTSEDVEIVFDEDQNLYQVVGSTTGKALIAADVNAALTQELHGFGTSCVLNADEVTEEPTLTDVTDYERVAECANRSRNTDIPIMVNGETVVVSYASQNSNWVTIGEGPSVVVNEDAIRAWTQDTVTWAVYREDEFDFYYLDQDAFVSEMVNRLQNGIVDAFEAPIVGERSIEGKSRDYAYERAGWDSSMGRYIDVDLEAQFARLFDENGEVIWETAVVTGDMVEGRSTETGVFSIYAMEQGVTLVGLDEDGDGQPDYESYVDYWMPFYGGLGLHDATWRYDFGGNLYSDNGSHGCVNLPHQKAAELYNMTFVGEKVYIHW